MCNQKLFPILRLPYIFCGVCTAFKGWLQAKIQHFCSKKAQSMQLLKEICGKKNCSTWRFPKMGYSGLFGATPILGNQRALGEARHVVFMFPGKWPVRDTPHAKPGRSYCIKMMHIKINHMHAHTQYINMNIIFQEIYCV